MTVEAVQGLDTNFSAIRLFRSLEPFPSSGMGSPSIISELLCQMGVQISGRCLTPLAYRMESSESWSPGGRPRNIYVQLPTEVNDYLGTVDHFKHSRTRIQFFVMLIFDQYRIFQGVLALVEK
jgi:hypothetical protein